jgi:hypothetical protein
MLDDTCVPSSFVGDVVAPYVYKCWQIWWEALHASVIRSPERGADGSDALA